MNSQSFSQFGLSAGITTAITRQGYSVPTEIQIQAISPMMEGRDIVATAQTGTGKTAAFLLPILDRIQRGLIKGNRSVGPAVLILAPTRELAAQIGESAANYSSGTSISHAVIFGGVPKPRQIKELKKRPQILVATPGRLLDLVQERTINLSAVECFVLDEGDRMLDMGFIPDVRRIVSMIKKERQTALFSATMPPQIESLASELLSNPQRLAAKSADIAVGRINQEVLHVAQSEKLKTLASLIVDRSMYKAIVFTRTKHRATRVAKQLAKQGITSDAIHGDKSQNARKRALASFQKGAIQVLVATDIASRGIDVDEITHVINFEIPNEPETYVHRIGRTARAGADGSAISLCDPSELPYLRAIERLQKSTVTINRDHPDHIEPPVSRNHAKSERGRRPSGRSNGSGGRGSNRRGSNRRGSGSTGRARTYVA